MKANYFNFKKFRDRYLITNEQGYFAFVNEGQLMAMAQGKFNLIASKAIEILKDRFFIYDEEDEVFAERVMESYRGNKDYLFSGTSLHILVMSNMCNMTCIYCQAQDPAQKKHGRMNFDTAKKVIDLIMQMPGKNPCIEFQGGEPLTNFETIKKTIEYTKMKYTDKMVTFSIVTNTLLMTDDMLVFFRENDVSVSTSLDGNEVVHNRNRKMHNGAGTYKNVIKNISHIREMGMEVGAIETTTRYGLSYAREMIEAYRKTNLDYLFIRPLTPLGYAKEHWDEIGYTPLEFVNFYKEALHVIIEYNRAGYKMAEGHATIFLRKILGHYSDNYMELRSPCGAGVGQMAYYYDGSVYTCDEGRMIAEMGDSSFYLGNVNTNSYDEMMDSQVCKVTCQASVLEALPQCCDCVYHSYCGTCPVVNLAMYNNIYEHEANGYRCRIYKGILDTIFGCIYDDNEIMEIFKSWI